MPYQFAEAGGTNVLLMASGLDKVQRWDGQATFTKPAGIIAPTSALTLGSGTPNNPTYRAIGTYYAFVRYVDKDGLVSNLSPVSNVLTVDGGDGTISTVTPGTPITLTVTGTSGSDIPVAGRKILIEGASLQAANGEWVIATVSGGPTYTITLLDSSAPVARVRYPGGGIWTQAAGAVNYSGIPVPPTDPDTVNPRIVAKQILRNTNGQTDVFYVDQHITDLTKTTSYSIRDDNETVADPISGLPVAGLSTQEAVPLLDSDGDAFANRHGIPPNDRRSIAYYLDRAYMAGEVEVNQGQVKVVNGSSYIEGIGVQWGSEMVGRVIYVNNAPKGYQIAEVFTKGVSYFGFTRVDYTGQDEAFLRITEPYAGTSQNYAVYGIRPTPDRHRQIFFSESGLPESWPATNALDLQVDGDEIVGLMPMASFLYILQRRNIYRFTTQNDPARDGFLYLASRRGSAGPRSWVVVEETAYLLDEQGVHVFQGGQSQPISEPIRSLFNKDKPGPYRLYFPAADTFHGTYDPQGNIIRFFVCLSGHYLPRHALAYDPRLRRWWIEEFPFPIVSSCLGQLNGRPQLFLGGESRRVYAFGIGTLDGPDASAGTVRGTVTSAGLVSLADTSAVFASAGLVGSPVVIVSGRGKGQRRVISSVSGTTIKVTQPWAVVPDTTSVYQLGGIQWSYTTRWFRFRDDETEQQRGIGLVFQPLTTAGTLDLRRFEDQSPDAVLAETSYTSDQGDGVASTEGETDLVVDLTKADGTAFKKFPGSKGLDIDGLEWVKWQLSGVTNEEPVKVLQVSLPEVVQ